MDLRPPKPIAVLEKLEGSAPAEPRVLRFIESQLTAMKPSPDEFEKLVAEGLKLIPEEFRPFLDNVQVVIEEEPSAELLEKMGVTPDRTLLGLYTGTPLTKRSIEYSGFPDRIVIFRRAFLEGFNDRDEIRREVARTVLHEVAHHFGIDDDRLVELGWS